jgi:hypothetical protein
VTPPDDSKLAVDLDVSVRTSEGGEQSPTVTVTVTVRNSTHETLDPGFFASELLVDDAPWPDWRLALNGTIDERLVQLPPGESAQFSRELPGPPLAPGSHTFVVRLGGTSSAPVFVEL